MLPIINIIKIKEKDDQNVHNLILNEDKIFFFV